MTRELPRLSDLVGVILTDDQGRRYMIDRAGPLPTDRERMLAEARQLRDRADRLEAAARRTA